MFERFPRHLEQQPLLRIHRQCLAGCDAEEVGVEIKRVVEESAGAGIDGAGMIGIVVEQRIQSPAAVIGEIRHHIGAGVHQVPQVVRRVDATGIAAADADDGDRFAACGFQPVQVVSGLQ